jgi:alkylation response protein AidB-like acyl-CoA dehydrogenase
MRFGDEAQKRTYLTPMARGEALWCQGFSEPDAGSDLASLRTRADRDGDEYVVNGEKIWTSYADVADFCFLLARTDQSARRHRGISVLLVPMDLPGIEVRKIPALIGDHSFHNLHFTDVRIPVTARLGAENEGWAVVREALAHERVGLPRFVRAALVLDGIEEWAAAHGIAGRPDFEARARETRACCEAARLLVYRVVDERAKARPPSAKAYVARVATVEAERAVASLADDVMGLAGLEGGTWADSQFRNGLAVGISSGTYEIQLNLVAQQVLELPRV